MKLRRYAFLTSILAGIILFAAGCRYTMHDQVAGSGVRQTQKRNVPSFISIATEGAFDIEVVGQKEQTLQIEGDDNILPLISTEVSNNVLHIRPLRNYSVNESIKLRISVPNLEGVSASGAGKIDISGLKNEEFEIDVNGAPTVTVAGETKVLKIDANGAGKIDTHKLRAAQVVVDSNGVSRVEVYATERLDVTISGPSHVLYEGEPAVNQTIHGPGSLEKRESKGA